MNVICVWSVLAFIMRVTAVQRPVADTPLTAQAGGLLEARLEPMRSTILRQQELIARLQTEYAALRVEVDIASYRAKRANEAEVAVRAELARQAAQAPISAANAGVYVGRENERYAIVPLEFLPGEFLDDIASSTVTQNNLGGQGPDPAGQQVIHFANAGHIGGEVIDLEVSNLTAYVPADEYAVQQNGRGARRFNDFGFINVACGTNVTLRYSFKDSSGTAVRLEEVWMTFLDFETGNRGEVKEYMGILSDYVEFHLAPDTELTQENMTDGGILWFGSEIGRGSDNPKDPYALTPVQQRRAVTVLFANVSFVDTVYGLTHRDDGSCGNGRNFMFSMTRGMVPTVAPTPGPTSPTKTKEPTPAPTPDENDTCATCVVWGDPHIITFKMHQRRVAEHPRREEFFRTRGWKSDQFSINTAGMYWLVKTDYVQIQGLYEHNETSNTTTLSSLAVGGPFVRDGVLVVRPLRDKTTWNGQEILASMPSEFQNNYVSAKFHNAAKMVKDGTSGPGIDIALPQGVTLRVNRWQHSLAVEISMCPAEGQSGQCGSLDADSF